MLVTPVLGSLLLLTCDSDRNVHQQVNVSKFDYITFITHFQSLGRDRQAN